MMPKLYVENNDQRYILTLAFNWASKPEKYVNELLCDRIKKVRSYLQTHRRNGFDYQNSWDCGRQDAFGDMVDQLFTEYQALKIAYKLQRGDATLANETFMRMVGL